MTTQRIALAVQATPEQVWQALTDGSTTPAYYLGFAADFDLRPGRPYRYTAGGGDMITGTVLEVEPVRRLRTTFEGHWAPDVEALPPAERARLLDGVDAVNRGVDEVIFEARRSVREGLVAGCDAAAVVGERVRFWSVLCEEEGRPLTVDLPAAPTPVSPSTRAS